MSTIDILGQLGKWQHVSFNISDLNDFCEDNAGCRDLKYSQCAENNKCVCLDHYIEVDDYCRGLIEANCLNNSDCAVEHSYCHESDTCRCFDNFYQSENRGECYPLAQSLFTL